MLNPKTFTTQRNCGVIKSVWQRNQWTDISDRILDWRCGAETAVKVNRPVLNRRRLSPTIHSFVTDSSQPGTQHPRYQTGIVRVSFEPLFEKTFEHARMLDNKSSGNPCATSWQAWHRGPDCWVTQTCTFYCSLTANENGFLVQFPKYWSNPPLLLANC